MKDGKPKKVVRDAFLPAARTFQQVRDHLEVLTILLGLRNASLMGHLVVKGIKSEEQELGLKLAVFPAARSSALTALPEFQRLAKRKQDRILMLYGRIGMFVLPNSRWRSGALIKVGDQSMTVREWSEQPGAVNCQTIKTRLRAGQSPKDAIFTPAAPYKGKAAQARRKFPSDRA